MKVFYALLHFPGKNAIQVCDWKFNKTMENLNSAQFTFFLFYDFRSFSYSEWYLLTIIASWECFKTVEMLSVVWNMMIILVIVIFSVRHISLSTSTDSEQFPIVELLMYVTKRYIPRKISHFIKMLNIKANNLSYFSWTWDPRKKEKPGRKNEKTNIGVVIEAATETWLKHSKMETNKWRFWSVKIFIVPRILTLFS